MLLWWQWRYLWHLLLPTVIFVLNATLGLLLAWTKDQCMQFENHSDFIFLKEIQCEIISTVICRVEECSSVFFAQWNFTLPVVRPYSIASRMFRGTSLSGCLHPPQLPTAGEAGSRGCTPERSPSTLPNSLLSVRREAGDADPLRGAPFSHKCALPTASTGQSPDYILILSSEQYYLKIWYLPTGFAITTTPIWGPNHIRLCT